MDNKNMKSLLIILGIVIGVAVLAVVVLVFVFGVGTPKVKSEIVDTISDTEETVDNSDYQDEEIIESVEAEYTKFYSGEEYKASSELELDNIGSAANEMGNIEELFDSFIKGEINARIDFTDESKKFNEYFYDELIKASEDGVISYSQLTEKERYVALDFGAEELITDYMVLDSDGGKLVALRYSGGIDGVYTFIFAENNGELVIPYAYESFSRSYTELCKDMTLRGYGSGGAGDSYEWVYYLDDDGHCHLIYNLNTMWSSWIQGPISEDLMIDTSAQPDAHMIYVKVGASKYVTYEDASGDIESKIDSICDEYVQVENAVKIAPSEIQGLINAEFEKCGKPLEAPEQTNSEDSWINIK